MYASRLSISLVCTASLMAGACSKSGGAAGKEDLALVPKESRLVIGVNVSRMRGTAMWKKLLDFGMASEKSKKDYEEFNKSCVDFSAADGPESMFIAVPDMSSATKDGIAIVRLKTAIDEPKFVKCLDYLAGKSGDKVVTTDYNGKKIYNTSKDPQGDRSGFVFLDGKTVAFASGAWAKRVIDLASGKDPASAKQNDALVALVKRAKTTDAVWGAGEVPDAVRDGFKGNPQLTPLASLKAVTASLDFASGLALAVDMDTGSDADAMAINDQVTAQLAEAKKTPAIKMMGLDSLVDGVKTEAKGPSFKVAMSYNQQQVDDMIQKFSGMFRNFGMGMGGGGPPPGMGGPPPGMGGPGMMPPAPGMVPPLAPPTKP